MNERLEAHCKGTFRSYKTFRPSGQVVLHTVQSFQEWDFSDTHVLTISAYEHPRKKTVCETDQWTFEFNNRRHYIRIRQPLLRYEIISVNHTGLVLAESDPGNKIFFARYPIWENFIKQKLPVF